MKKSETKLTWEQLLEDDRAYKPDAKFVKAYCKNMLYVVNKTNLQTGMLYFILLMHRNHTDGSCFPSLETLSIEAGVSVKTIQAMLKKLKKEGIINVIPGKQGRCNSYSFPLEKFDKKKETHRSSSNKISRGVSDDEFDFD